VLDLYKTNGEFFALFFEAKVMYDGFFDVMMKKWSIEARSSARGQKYFEPAGTGSDFLPGVLGAPTFRETYADGVDVDGSGVEARARR